MSSPILSTRIAPRHHLYATVGALAFSLSLSSASAQDMEDRNACYLAPTLMEDGSPSAKPGFDELNDAYDCFEEQLLTGYSHSKHVLAKLVPDWDRDSYAPFQYEDAGEHYVVVYGNDRATGEETTLWLDRDLPVGATMAAAGFSVSEDGKLMAEPLMIYEKMSQGYIFGRGNWRKTLIAPNGDLMGVTNGPGEDMITACADCLARSADRMYLAMMNDGIMPADAPEPSTPIGAGPAGNGAVVDPGAILSPLGDGALDPLAPLDPNADVPPAQTFDPNGAVDPNVTSDPLAPLSPLEPLDPDAPLDPLAPLEPLETGEAPSTEGTLPSISPLNEPLATLPSAEPILDDVEDAVADAVETIEDGVDGLSESLSDGTDAFNSGIPDGLSGLDDAVDSTTDALADTMGTEGLGSSELGTGTQTDTAEIPAISLELQLELSEATDPVLPVPPIQFDPPPYLELPENGAGA